VTPPDRARPEPIRLRAVVEGDLPAIERIYAHHVLNGFGSFEEVPPDLAELDRRRREVLGRGLPYFVAEGAKGVVGFSYAAPYRTRSAYRYTLEDSVYIAAEAIGQGHGRALLGRLVERCAELGYRQMVAVIGDSANAASIGLHQALGFAPAGRLAAVGFKRGRWIDSVLMQRALGPGSERPPK
jgi:L-amino acid N-acyltransferase YncA